MDFWRSWPYPVALAVLFVVILIRANATYWLGRAAGAGADRTRLRTVLASGGYRRARDLLTRWGAPAITLSFLTVGLQTLINLAAGVLRMSYWRYLPAMIIGGVLWSFCYATFGFVSLDVWLRLYDRSPVAAIGLIIVLALSLVGFIVWRRRRPIQSENSAERSDPTRAKGVDPSSTPGRYRGQGDL